VCHMALTPMTLKASAPMLFPYEDVNIAAGLPAERSPRLFYGGLRSITSETQRRALLLIFPRCSPCPVEPSLISKQTDSGTSSFPAFSTARKPFETALTPAGPSANLPGGTCRRVKRGR
jgi:hypothetical protein